MSTTTNIPVIFLGEIGQQLEINNNDEQKKLYTEKITNKESYLYDNNGVLINNIENIFSKEQNNDENKKSSNNNIEERYFIFNKKYEKDSTLKILDEYFKNIISNYDSQINLDQKDLPDVYTHYNLLIEKSDDLKYLKADDIKSTYERMLEFFQNYKVIYTTFKVNSHICEIIKKNYKYQNLGINALINNINKTSEICESKQTDAVSECSKLNEIKEQSLKMLSEGLDNLRKKELHPVLKTNGKKFLYDIYLDEKKMEEIKDELVQKEEVISKNIREKSVFFSSERNKLINEKALSITEIKNDWSNISLEYDTKYNELINEPNKIYENLLQDFLYFKQSLLIIFDYLNNLNLNKDKKEGNISVEEMKAFDESCGKINNLKNKYIDFVSLNQLQSKLEPINELLLKMRKNLESFSVRVNKIFNILFSIQKNLSEISEKFIMIKEKAINLEEYFNQLLKPSKFPMAYESALEEIKRRMIFNYKIKNFFKKLENFVKNEGEIRKQFGNEHGIYLPIGSFPYLKYFDLKLKTEINTDEEMNKFPKLLSEEEVKILAESDTNFDLSEKNNTNTNKSANSNLESKIKDLNAEIVEKDKVINNLKMQLDISINSIEKICNNFRFILSMKDKEIKNKIKECDNIVNYVNNKYSNNIQSCPMCNQSALNNEQYANVNIFLNEMQNKYSNNELQLKQVQEKYSNLVVQTIHLKKIFFDHMNTKIANFNKNSKMNGGRDTQDTPPIQKNNIPPSNDFQILKSLINDEKLKNNNLVTELNLLKAKYDLLLCDMKKLENKYEQQKLKLNSTNEKLISVMKKNEIFKEEILLHENQKKISEDSISNLKQLVSQINEEKQLIDIRRGKEIQKIKNRTIIFKDIKEGDRCIFVPHSENIYVCINLTQDLNQINSKFFRCDIILDFSSFEEDKKKMIIENSLIVIGSISELKEVIIKEGDKNPYEVNNEDENDEEDEFTGSTTLTTIKSFLKSSNSYYLAKISNVDYIIGFPGEELVFMNYNNLLNKKIKNS